MLKSDWSTVSTHHNNVLQAHVSMLDSIRKRQDTAKSVQTAVEECWKDARRMVQNFERLCMVMEQDKLSDIDGGNHKVEQETMDTNGVTSNNVDDVSLQNETRSRKRARIEHTLPLRSSSQEHLGSLFTIDTNPTAVEQLLSETVNPKRKAQRNGKRKLDQSRQRTLGLGGPAIAKHSESTDVNGIPDESSSQNLKTHATISDKNGNYEEEFDAKVAQKHAEREARRQKKLEKKRKRESATSLEDHAQADAWPTKTKRQKGRPAEVNEENPTTDKKRKIDNSGQGNRSSGPKGSEGGRNKKKKKS